MFPKYWIWKPIINRVSSYTSIFRKYYEKFCSIKYNLNLDYIFNIFAIHSKFVAVTHKFSMPLGYPLDSANLEALNTNLPDCISIHLMSFLQGHKYFCQGKRYPWFHKLFSELFWEVETDFIVFTHWTYVPPVFWKFSEVEASFKL